MLPKIFFTLILAFHGLLHLPGFIRAWNIAALKRLAGKTIYAVSGRGSKILGILWLVACLVFLMAAYTFLFRNNPWWWFALFGVTISQFLIITYWRDARAGILPNLLILLVIVPAWASWNFDRMVAAEVRELFSQPIPPASRPITPEMLNGLPHPVRNWLTGCGILGKKPVFAVRLKQKGWMRTEHDQQKWMETDADQYFTLRRPGFIWEARIRMMPLVSIAGRDKFMDGKGNMLVKLHSLFKIVDAADQKIDQGALQRFLAEIVWFPAAALMPYIQWEELDSTSAAATMNFRGVHGSGIFQFNDRGEFVQFSTRRYMGGGDRAKLEKWVITATENRIMNGIKIPVKCQVTWELESGDFTWLKLEITGIEYNQPQIF